MTDVSVSADETPVGTPGESRAGSRASEWLRGGTLVLLFVCIYQLQSVIDDRYGEYRATEEILYIEDGELLKKALLGFENLAADLYWLRTVQYFGGKRRQVTDKRYDLLAPLLEMTTTLDPNFKIAYSYGATFLSEPHPMGAGVPLKGIEHVDRGIANHPDYWRFYLDKGFIYAAFLHDYDKAAEAFLEGDKIPGAPYWMKNIASRILTEGGEREMARELWRIVYETAENDQIRENAVVHLAQLDALDQMEVLEGVIASFQEEEGRLPKGWQEMIQRSYLNRVPLDPSGNPYLLEPATGRVEVSAASGLGVFPPRR